MAKESPAPRDEKRSSDTERTRKRKLTVDISAQAEIGREVPPEEIDVVQEVFRMICQAADFLHARGERRGALIIIGTFASAGQIADARAGLRPDPFKGLYVSVADKTFQRLVLQGAVGEGAVIAEESGQILAGGILVKITHWDMRVPSGGFMRHMAAASTSTRRDVKASITLSEETNIARVFKRGKVVAEYDPAGRKREEPAARRPQEARPQAKADASEKGKGPIVPIVETAPVQPAPAPQPPAERAAAPARTSKRRRKSKKRSKASRRAAADDPGPASQGGQAETGKEEPPE